MHISIMRNQYRFPVAVVLLVLGIFTVIPKSAFSQTRIFGGGAARKGEFPWIAQIRVESPWYNGHSCGASIINNTHILTAAHCVTDLTEHYLVTVGEHRLNYYEGTEQTFKVEEIIIHPGYDYTEPSGDDIAIVRLHAPISFNENIQPAKLGTADPTEGNVVAAGWGRLFRGGFLPSVLQKVTLPVVSFSTCQSKYSSVWYGEVLKNPGMICAGGNGKGICHGDSGGPLMTESGEVVGIMSFLFQGRCDNPTVPAVYTSVASYADWIRN